MELLHFSAFRSQEDALRLLLECGQDLTAKTSTGVEPLHAAALFRGRVVVQILLEHGT